jgi:hypothetical protein
MMETKSKYMRAVMRHEGRPDIPIVIENNPDDPECVENLKKLQLGLIETGGELVFGEEIDEATYCKEQMQFVYDEALDAMADLMSYIVDPIRKCMAKEVMGSSISMMQSILKQIEEHKLPVEISLYMRALSEGKVNAKEVFLKKFNKSFKL